MLTIIFNRGSKDIEDENYVFSPDTYFNYNFESGKYSSWERYFTWLLEHVTRDTIYEYHKNKLNAHYLTKGNVEKVKRSMPV